jgi:hypothetical protein
MMKMKKTSKRDQLLEAMKSQLTLLEWQRQLVCYAIDLAEREHPASSNGAKSSVKTSSTSPRRS